MNDEYANDEYANDEYVNYEYANDDSSFKPVFSYSHIPIFVILNILYTCFLR
jgi:hypothetical protein